MARHPARSCLTQCRRSVADEDQYEYRADRVRKFAVERLLFLAAERIIDLLDHYLSARFDVVSDNYEAVIQNAGARGVIPAGLYEELRSLDGFRNVLAHEYLLVRDDEVYANCRKFREILPSVVDALQAIANSAL
ncbi:type VII toxin-antitoxin system HepT family RNase toxin [Salinispira pacifica]